MKRFALLLFVAVHVLSFQAFAADQGTPNAFQQFSQDLTTAYAHYRVALFQTNKNDQEMSLKSATAFQQQWQALVANYKDAPPEVFAVDPHWKATLESIRQIVAAGLEDIEDGELAEAHETLEAIRDEIGDLRRRNSVIMFSDHINIYHEKMEHLLIFGAEKDTLDDAALAGIREELGVLNFLAENIRINTPPDFAENEQYQGLLKGLFGSLTALRQALDAGESEAILQAIRNLKAPYAKLFVNFG